MNVLLTPLLKPKIMKNLFLAFTFLCFVTAFSQDEDDNSRPTDKGSFLVNSGLSFNISTVERPESYIEDTR
jgi:hypothetical protein